VDLKSKIISFTKILEKELQKNDSKIISWHLDSLGFNNLDFQTLNQNLYIFKLFLENWNKKQYNILNFFILIPINNNQDITMNAIIYSDDGNNFYDEPPTFYAIKENKIDFVGKIVKKKQIFKNSLMIATMVKVLVKEINEEEIYIIISKNNLEI
jgi:hypothetical protein